jgi:hypothetical protein
MFIINLFLSLGSIEAYIAAFHEDILSVYFSSAFSVLIILDLTSIESPIFAVNEEKIFLLFL